MERDTPPPSLLVSLISNPDHTFITQRRDLKMNYLLHPELAEYFIHIIRQYPQNEPAVGTDMPWCWDAPNSISRPLCDLLGTDGKAC